MHKKEWGKNKVHSSIQQARLSRGHYGHSEVRNVEEGGWAFLRLKKLRLSGFRVLQVLVLIFLVQSFSLQVFSSPRLDVNQERQKELVEDALVQRNIRFNIPQQRADLALTLFAEQANLTLVFPFDDVKEKVANQLVGQYSLQEAATKLLAGTGLFPSFGNQLVLTITTEIMSGDEDMNRKKNILAATIAFFVGVGAVPMVVGQDDVNAKPKDNYSIEEIVVTAQKREERLIDVPMSISVVNNEMIERRGIQNFTDLSYAVPNLSVAETSPGNLRISMRGVSNLTGSSPLVGIYLDEIPLSTSTYIKPSLQAIDIKQIEVLKGPQGTLYGQGSVGGTLRFITNPPVLNKLSGDITASIYDTANGSSSNELTVIANLPIMDDQLAFRIAGSYKDKGGWIDRENDDAKDVNSHELSHVRISGLWEASDELSITAMAIQHRADLGAMNLVNTTHVNDSKYLQSVRNGLGVSPTNSSNEYDIYSLVVIYDLNFATLTSATSKSNIEETAATSVNEFVFAPEPGTPFDQFLYNTTTSSIGFTQELRLTSTSDNMNWTLGLYYDDLDDGSVQLGSAFYSAGVPIAVTTSTTIIDGSSNSTSVFGNISYNINDKVTADLGGRYYEDDISQLVLSGSDILTNETASFDNASFRGALTYAAADNANIYFSVSQGFRSGGMNFSTLPYEPENMLSYEVGAKARLFDNRLHAEVALYHSTYTDYQAFSVDSQGFGLISNPGEAVIQGVEWSALWALSDFFSLGFNGNYTESEFTKINPNSSIFMEGDTLNDIPKYNYSLSANFDFQWFSAAQGFANFDYSRQAGTNLVNRATGFLNPVVESEDIGFLNAQIGAQLESISIKLFGRNLSNELKSTAAASFTNDSIQRRPRTIGLELNYEF